MLWRLLNHKDASNFTFKVLVRSPEKAGLFGQFGVEAIVGSLADLDTLEKLSEESDYVVNTVSSLPGSSHSFSMITYDLQADIDDLTGTRAMLKGLEKKFGTTGQKGIFIHTVCVKAICDLSVRRSNRTHFPLSIVGNERACGPSSRNVHRREDIH